MKATSVAFWCPWDEVTFTHEVACWTEKFMLKEAKSEAKMRRCQPQATKNEKVGEESTLSHVVWERVRMDSSQQKED